VRKGHVRDERRSASLGISFGIRFSDDVRREERDYVSARVFSAVFSRCETTSNTYLTYTLTTLISTITLFLGILGVQVWNFDRSSFPFFFGFRVPDLYRRALCNST
jgi:hypothetical protein